jgi:cytoskeleton protein RodZ
VRQIEALERDDFSGFQGPVFVHGFIRNYAKLLGLDPGLLIRAADSLLNPTPIPVAPEPAAIRERDAPVSGKSKWPLVAGVAVVVVVAGLVLANNRGQSRSKQAPDSTASEQVAAAPALAEKREAPARPVERAAEKAASGKPAAEKSAQERAAQEKATQEKERMAAEKRVGVKAAAEKPAVEKPVATAPDTLPGPSASGQAAETGPQMVVRMFFDQDSWVEIKDRNGNTVFGQLNPAGSRRSARGEPPLSIVVGNAAGVRLFQGDKSIDLAPHTRVDVARLTLE